jgi:Fur family ferric uptake transcriptional regulator
MSNRHEQEKKQLKRLFQQQGVDHFDSRVQVLEAFLKLEHHVTIEELVVQLEQDGGSLDKDFILNSMELLCLFGFASKIEFEDKETQYEHRHLGVHHDHMVCTKCGSILEFKDEAIEKQQIRLADAYGFHMLQHKMEIYGICSSCMEQRTGPARLNNSKQGELLVIKGFDAGKSMQLRISSMGLRVEDVIEVISTGFGGQVVIASGDNRLVIGKGMAEKIQVLPYDGIKMPGFEDSNEGARISLPSMQLSQMKAGQKGVIKRVAGETNLRRRLLEMGINRGTTIYVEKYAPLRDPIELVVKGYHISLRVMEAASIFVENVEFEKK